MSINLGGDQGSSKIKQDTILHSAAKPKLKYNNKKSMAEVEEILIKEGLSGEEIFNLTSEW